MELGLFEIKETSITHSNGNIIISKTPKVTGKGQIYFMNKFKFNFSFTKEKEVKQFAVT
jgi:anti-repressor protein